MKEQWFTYCPNAGYELHDSEEAALKESAELIAQYLDDGWEEDVTSVQMGKVTHQATQTNVVKQQGELDEDGNDEDGVYWTGEHDIMCDYEMLPVGSSQ